MKKLVFASVVSFFPLMAHAQNSENMNDFVSNYCQQQVSADIEKAITNLEKKGLISSSTKEEFRREMYDALLSGNSPTDENGSALIKVRADLQKAETNYDKLVIIDEALKDFGLSRAERTKLEKMRNQLEQSFGLSYTPEFAPSRGRRR